MTSALDHWSAVGGDHAMLVDFLDWLESRHAIDISAQSSDCPFELLDDFKPSKLADRFLKIDRRQIEIERQEILKRQRLAFLQADLEMIERFIADTPETNVIDRSSWQSRREKIISQIKDVEQR